MTDQELTLPGLHEVVIVGAGGRIGGCLSAAARAGGWVVHEVTRAGGLRERLGAPDDDAPLLPVVVCTRNDDLDAVLAALHPDRWPDLVFVQNGMIEPWLLANGLEGVTRGVLYFAVQRRGERPISGADSVFWGPWSEPLAHLFDRAGLQVRAVEEDGYRREMAVKLAWIDVFGVMGEVTGQTVGELALDLADDVAELCFELVPLLSRDPGVAVSAPELTRRLLDYSAAIPHFHAGLREWRWRNGWLELTAERLGVPLPVHGEWLARARAGGWSLPQE